MTGSSSLCIEVRIRPLDGAHVSHEQFIFCCPLPHVAGSPDFHQAFGSSSLLQLVGPYKPGLSLTDLPCPHGIDFGLSSRLLLFRPANLPVYASQWPLPVTTQ